MVRCARSCTGASRSRIASAVTPAATTTLTIAARACGPTCQTCRSILHVPTSSRAGSLLHWVGGVVRFYARHKSPCGSGLAREGGVPDCIDAGCAGLFASKPAPTFDPCYCQILCPTQFPVGVSLLAKAERHPAKILHVPTSSRAGSLLHWVGRVVRFYARHKSPVGAGLLAKAVCLTA